MSVSLREIDDRLLLYMQEVRPIAGLKDATIRQKFSMLLYEESTKVNETIRLSALTIGKTFADPADMAFDPLLAAAFHLQTGDRKEAWWLVFLAIYFGRHHQTGWGLLRGVYSGLGPSVFWNWERASSGTDRLKSFIIDHQLALRACGSFGSHHKHASMDPYKAKTIAAEITAYVSWTHTRGGMDIVIDNAIVQVGHDPSTLFDYVYHSLHHVLGSAIKFDFLSMAGKLSLAGLEPSAAYLSEALEPEKQACLLFAGRRGITFDIDQLSHYMTTLADHLDLPFGMQVLRNALSRLYKKI